MRFLLALILLLVAPQQVLHSQLSDELGLPLIKSFSAEDYQAHNQNWAITQDHRGVMYFGNTNGVLEYDGNTWRLLPFPSIVRSIDADDDGQIYVGAQGDFGYLEADSSGTMQFISLIGLLSEADREFTNVWKTYATGDGVYFNALSHLFRWNKNSLSVWHPGASGFGWSFIVRDTLYIQKRGVGIFRMLNDSLELLPGTEELARVSIYFMLPFENSKLLIGTRSRGLEIYGNGEITRFDSEIESFIQENRIYTARTLSDGTIAIGSDGGLLLISNKGKFIKAFTNAEGFIDKSVLSLFSDRQDHLWVGLQDGICRMDWPSPLTNYSQESGLDNHLEVVLRHNGILYVAGSSGLFYLEPSQFKNGQIKNSHFRSIKELEGLDCIALLSFDEKLMIGTRNGIYVSENGMIEHIGYEGIDISCFYHSKQDQNRVFAGGPGILVSFRLENGRLIDEGMVNGIIGDIRPILEQEDGKLWLGTRYGGPILVDFSKGFTKDPAIEQFDESFGIPDGDIYPFSLGNRIVFAGDSGLYRFDENNRKFIPDTTLGELFAGKARGKEVFRITVDDGGNVWIVTVPHFGKQRRLADGTFQWETAPYMKMNPLVYSILAEKTGVSWFGGPGGLSRYDEHVSNNQIDYHTLVRKVMVNTDSLIYFGNFSSPIIPVLDYKQNDLSFEFSATDFVDETRTQYQFFLEGYDKKWSSWTTEKRKEYTNLPKGDYIFRVKARNIYDQISQEGNYEFSILPPWWYTWLAKVAYAILALLLLRAFVHWRVAKLRKRQKELEEEIAAATTEIRTQKEEVEAQRDEIEAQRDQLEVQRDIVLDQKNEIVDSINYAQRIQSALLPPETYVSELLNENFILFKPRDIVSGDFYWIKQVNQYIVLVAADCTGHGVPGAFMSMLGMSYLNEIVQRREITQANHVLNELRKQIKNSLRQRGLRDESKDGIDMALCVLDLKSMKLQYAGANNPLYLIKDVNGKPELMEIKADRMPLGYYQGKDTSFVNHDIKFDIGDSFYMFSDGFIDQKGGKDNRKFMSKNFKNLLLEINDQAMYDQKEILEKTLSDWMGDNSQMDDILVIGVRL